MKAAVLRKPGTPLAVEEVELEQPRVGEVLVRVQASGVCHSDLHYMTGDLSAPLPVVPGREGVGIVEQVGSNESFEAMKSGSTGRSII